MASNTTSRLLIFCLVAGWFWVAGDQSYASEPIKVMTYNVRFDGHGNRPSPESNAWLSDTTKMNRRERVLKVIADANPDLLGVQEALAHQVQDIANQLPNHAYYAIGRDDGKDEGECCGIYWRSDRFAAVDQGTFWLSETPNQPGSRYPNAACTRIASWVRLRELHGAEREFIFLNTHWDHVCSPAREFSASKITDHLASNSPELPAIVTGDLNATEDSAEIVKLLSSTRVELRDAYRLIHPEIKENEATFSGFDNKVKGKRIDYVLHSPAFKPSSAEIIRTTFEGLNASDHFPVLVELHWQTQQ